MNIAIALVVFIVAALIVWGCAELNYKNFSYEEDKPHHPDPTAHQGGEYKELNIRDIMRDNSTKATLPCNPLENLMVNNHEVFCYLCCSLPTEVNA